MFRKTLIAATAVATIAAALVPTTASAKSFKYWGGGSKYWAYGVGFAVAAPLIYGASCVRYVETRYGDIVKVYVC